MNSNLNSPKITLHATRRMKSRLKLSGAKKQSLHVSIVWKDGIKEDQITNEKLENFLLDKGTDNVKIIYDGYLYIFGRNSHRLITLYPLSQELLEELNND